MAESAPSYILVVNLGSSSGKFSLFTLGGKDTSPNDPCSQANVEFDSEHEQQARQAIARGLQSVLNVNQVAVAAQAITAVGHRVVHGGEIYTQSVVIDDNVEKNIAQLERFAPIHNKLNLFGVQACAKMFGKERKQVAVFDTAFHHTIPEVASRYAVPYEWLEKYGIKRYGFHGISLAHAVERSAELLQVPKDSFTGIVCHLGNGCSICAVHKGKSIDTSMGFTPLEGLMMGTRSGSIDPGILLQMITDEEVSSSDLSRILNYESGLAGVSGISADMRLLLKQAATGSERAKLAIEMFVYRIQSFIGSYFVHLDRPKAIVFTGGIGENSPQIRKQALATLHGIGCMLDEQRNEQVKEDADVSASSSSIRTLVIKSREDKYIFRETQRLVC